MKLYYPNLCSVNLAVPSPPTVSGASVNVMQAPQRGIWKLSIEKFSTKNIHGVIFQRYGRCQASWQGFTPDLSVAGMLTSGHNII